MKNKIEPKTLAGFMELLPHEQIVFNKYMDKIKSNYEKFGFMPLDTPILEMAEILLAKAGGETEKQIYRFNKGDTDLALRFDLTVPLAKYVAMNYNELQFPFKRYQIGKVYRGERPQKGRYREFYQCDIDIVNEDELSMTADAEMVSVIYMTFKDLNLGDFTVHVNNRKVLNGLFEYYGIKENGADILRAIDRLPKVGEEKVVGELEEIGIPFAIAKEILKFLNTRKDSLDMLTFLEQSSPYSSNEMYKSGVDELIQLIKYSLALQVPKENVIIDLSIARGLDYYTGTVYETFLSGHEDIGSVCSGGRYDNLAEYYTDKRLPGVGVSIGLTRLFYKLQEQGLVKEQDDITTKVIILPMENCEMEAMNIASECRDNNIVTQVYLGNKKLKGQLKYADRLGVKYAVIIGENEIKNDLFQIKNMKTGESIELKKNDICKYLLEDKF